VALLSRMLIRIASDAIVAEDVAIIPTLAAAASAQSAVMRLWW